MQDPVGCGKCDARFCRFCLYKAIGSKCIHVTVNNNNNNNESVSDSASNNDRNQGGVEDRDDSNDHSPLTTPTVATTIAGSLTAPTVPIEPTAPPTTASPTAASTPPTAAPIAPTVPTASTPPTVPTASTASTASTAPTIDTSRTSNVKCPCCRTVIKSVMDVVPDLVLRRRIEGTNLTIVCPNVNCGEKLKLRDVRAHESKCGYMVLRCKYASFGCSWVGPKKDIDAHERVGCKLAPVAGLIERHRRTTLEHSNMIMSLQQHVSHYFILYYTFFLITSYCILNEILPNCFNCVRLRCLNF